MALQFVLDDVQSSQVANAVAGNKALSHYTPGGTKITLRQQTVIGNAAFLQLVATPVVVVPAVPNFVIVPKYIQIQARGTPAQMGFPTANTGFAAAANVAAAAGTNYAPLTAGAAGSLMLEYAQGITIWEDIPGGQSVFGVGGNKTSDYISGSCVDITAANNVATPLVNSAVQLTKLTNNFTGGAAGNIFIVTVDYELHQNLSTTNANPPATFQN